MVIKGDTRSLDNGSCGNSLNPMSPFFCDVHIVDHRGSSLLLLIVWGE